MYVFKWFMIIFFWHQIKVIDKHAKNANKLFKNISQPMNSFALLWYHNFVFQLDPFSYYLFCIDEF